MIVAVEENEINIINTKSKPTLGAPPIMKFILKFFLATACSSLAISAAHAQARIYAVSGTVTSINPKIQMTEVDTDDGTTGHFRWIKTPGPAVDFNKSVSADATPADKFTIKGTHAIVYFFGEGDVRTVVALRDLGAAPVTITIGTVVKFNRKERTLTLKKTTGEAAEFHLDPKTVVATPDGVMEDLKFDLNKGNSVRVTSAQANGSDTALLITPSM
jgi:hypothetical protein